MKRKIKIALMVIVIIIVLLLAFALLFLHFYPGIGKTPGKRMQEVYEQKTEYFYDGKFHNFEDKPIITEDYHPRKDTEVRPEKKIPVNVINEFPKAGENLTITWLGHSSSIVQLHGKNIMFDPVLTKYASPVNFVGSERFSEIALATKDVPEIDCLILSHDHYDHMDYQTIKEIDDKVKKYIVPLGVESYLIGWGIDEERIVSLGWWEDVQVDNITITSIPGNHYSGRNPLKNNATWWSGYHITDQTNSLYFTGDTGYIEAFSDVYEKFGGVDVLLADSGQYNESWSGIHMNPLQALQTAKDVHARYYIPVHWGTFALSDHDWYEPVQLATENAGKYGVHVITPRIGEYVKFSEIENYQERWWEPIMKNRLPK